MYHDSRHHRQRFIHASIHPSVLLLSLSLSTQALGNDARHRRDPRPGGAIALDPRPDKRLRPAVRAGTKGAQV